MSGERKFKQRQKYPIPEGKEMPRETEALEMGSPASHKKIIRKIMTIMEL